MSGTPAAIVREGVVLREYQEDKLMANYIIGKIWQKAKLAEIEEASGEDKIVVLRDNTEDKWIIWMKYI